MSLTALQNPETWQATNRWDDDVMDVWFKTKLSNGREFGLAPTHEEPITKLMRNFISSYKDLPSYPYQFQTKFRAELRSKSGLMRGREFLMKDLYSFSKDKEQHDEFYEEISKAYLRIFDRLGLGRCTFKTFASGGSFAKFSHEFQTISPVGEDTIYVSHEKGIAINQEVYNDKVLAELGVKKEDLVEEKAVEVGNIFTLGYKFSEALGLKFIDSDEKEKLVFMGSYGIGPSRVMGLIAEHFADDKGLVWPKNIAPAKIYLVQIGEDAKELAEEVYNKLTNQGIEVIYDDRNTGAGQKFADSDLMGIPYRLTISSRAIKQGRFELVTRKNGEIEELTIEDIYNKFMK